jgi:tRNA (cmo5U34)-methyltransferase
VTATNEWTTEAHAGAYLARGADWPPHRSEGEAVLLASLPPVVARVLDLGTGDGRLLAAVLAAHPDATGIGLDGSPPMLAAATDRFAHDSRAKVIGHDLDRPLDAAKLGRFDAVVSAFAIHHCTDRRKAALYAEVARLLNPGGVFANLEHVASSTPALHLAFLDAIGVDPKFEDPSNKLRDVESQLVWFRDAGLVDVDCHWKWRELALLVGRQPVRRQPVRRQPVRR